MDPDADQIRKWLLEEDNGSDVGHDVLSEFDDSADSDAGDDIISEHDSHSEQSADEGDDISPSSGVHYLGRDKLTVWNAHPPRQSTRRRRRNIVLHPPGVKGEGAKNAQNVFEAWKLFFTDGTIEDITNYTNDRLRKMRSSYSKGIYTADTNTDEICALIGLLYLAGVNKSSHQRVEDLWDTDGTAPEYFRLVMSYNRFLLLLRALRFDEANTRQMRRAVDKLAPIRKVFDEFVRRCKDCYSVSEYVTIDEMLESFRGRCSFRQYMPNKPAKYGIKVFAMVDARMFYTTNMEVYVGKQPDGPFVLDTRPAAVVSRLVEPIRGSGRNVTIDNWFSSVPLVNQLVREENLTVVATLRKNKTELPPEIVITKQRPPNSSLFAFTEDCMVVSYVPRKNRNVILISSMHDSDEIDGTTGDLCKPSAVSFYNLTKGGVDVVDQMKSTYSVARICYRWPLRIFFTLLDIGAINAQIILSSNTNENSTRRKFLKNLAMRLTRNHMVKRLSMSGVRNDIKIRIKKHLRLPSEELVPESTQSREEAKCAFCPKRKNRKTKTRCADCRVPICGQHVITICHKCRAQKSSGDDTEED